MKTCKEKALEWGISDRSVNNMCKTGKIPGVMKEKRCLEDTGRCKQTCR